MTRELVLVPGLWMPGAAVSLLAARLRRRGYAVRVFAYSGRAAHEENIAALVRFVHAQSSFVGHSLGGVLVLDMLNRHPEVAADAVVLLGAPVRGCLAGRRFGRHALGRWMMGESLRQWQERSARWTRDAPLGVIAGTLPLGLGRAVGGRLPGESDGVVCVEETAVDGMADRVLIKAGHSMLILSSRVGALVERFLAAGRFA